MEMIGKYSKGNGGYVSGSICSCGKKCYTRVEAQNWINNLKRHHVTTSYIGKGGNMPKRSYHCTICNMWHLTHLKNSSRDKGKIKIYHNDIEDDFSLFSSMKGKDISKDISRALSWE